MSGPLALGYQLVFLNTTIHPLAVCNDGSSAAYYIHRGDPSRWVLHQQGGWWCWDDYSCLVRWNHFSNHSTELRTLMSTSALAELTKQHDTFNGEKNTGIMAHNGTVNTVASASKVFLVYCSSDSHAGNRTTHSEFAPSGVWHFRGKEIVRAVLEDLSAREQLQRATQVLLTGGSAGGMATLNNADWVGAYVRTVAPAARFVAMPDSGYFLDVMPGAMCQLPDRYECRCAQPPAADGGVAAAAGHGWLGPGQTLAQQAQNMIGYTGGLPDASCAAHHGRWGSWRCYLGEYAAPHIVTPTLLLQSQIDVRRAWGPKPQTTRAETPDLLLTLHTRMCRDRSGRAFGMASSHTPPRLTPTSTPRGSETRHTARCRTLPSRRTVSPSSGPTATTTGSPTTHASGRSRRAGRVPRPCWPGCLRARSRESAWTAVKACRAHRPRRGTVSASR